MTVDFTCEGCGQHLRAAKPGDRVRCPACGGVGRVPADAITDHKPTASECPECKAALAAGAVLCVNCGYHLVKGKRLTTRHKRARREWHTSDALPRRFLVLIPMLMVLLFLLGLLFPKGLLLPWGSMLLVATALIVTLIGSGLRCHITLERERGGPFRLSRRRSLFLLPLGSWSIRVDARDNAYINFVDLGRDRWGREQGYYTLDIARDRHDAARVVYRGSNQQLMHEIADALRDLAGVHLDRR